MRFRVKKGQGATEYAIFIAAVLAGLIAMQVYYQRSVKGNMRSRADSIGEQFDNDGTYKTGSSSYSYRKADTNNANTDGGWTKSLVSKKDDIDGMVALQGALGATKVTNAGTGATETMAVTAVDEGEGSASISNDTLKTSNVAGSVWTDTGS